MNRKEFKEELREYIDNERNSLSCVEETYINYPNEFTPTAKEMINKKRAILDKLEQDYFSPFMVNIDNIKKFDADGNLINEIAKEKSIPKQVQGIVRDLSTNKEKEMSTTELVEKGLLKVFNEYIKSRTVMIDNLEGPSVEYATSLCQIADKLLQIESDRKLSEEYYKNCTID